MKILEYHEIVAGRPDEIHAVSVSQFARQMSWLYENEYRVVALEDWVKDAAYRLPRQAAKSLVITFDDGYQDNFTQALPILQEFGYPATIFLTTSVIGGQSAWREGSLANSPMLTWEQVSMMANSGIVFGSHTANHVDLTQLSQPDVDFELKSSKADLEQRLGKTAELFSYPYSRSNSDVKQRVEIAGYLAACTYLPFYVGGAGRDPYDLQRIGILADDGIEEFSQKIRGALNRRIKWRRSQLRKCFRQQ